MARWLDLDIAAGVALLGRGLGSGSEGEDDDGDGECEGEGDAGEGRGGGEGWDGGCASGGREVQWEDAQRLEGDSWRHEIAHCPRALPARPDGREQIGCAVASVCHLNVHRLTLGAEDAASLNCSLAALALCHEVAAAGCKREASNVGGFHSEVDLLAWEEIRRSPLPALLSNALEQVERAESTALGREALQFAPAATEVGSCSCQQRRPSCRGTTWTTSTTPRPSSTPLQLPAPPPALPPPTHMGHLPPAATLPSVLSMQAAEVSAASAVGKLRKHVMTTRRR